MTIIDQVHNFEHQYYKIMLNLITTTSINEHFNISLLLGYVLFFCFLVKRVLGITMLLDISAILTPQGTCIICH